MKTPKPFAFRANVKRWPRNLTRWLVILVLPSLIVGGCADSPSTLDPKGPGAAHIADLWWLLFWMATAVFVIVLVFLIWGLFRRRGTAHDVAIPDEETVARRGSRTVVLAGIVAPTIILLVVFGATLRTFYLLRTPPTSEDLTIHVIGRRWWWEVNYPTQQITTANEIHIPVGQPVQFVLTSPNVIHSFWVPELQGKVDLVPGNTNTLWLQADEPGVYWGECAEFCGVQHTRMNFLIIAQPQETFEAWAAQQRQPARVPADEVAQQGHDVFMDNTCIDCHTIRGTSATGNLGPDLTHMASRRTLGSATLANTPGNLGGWIANPQHIKPGNLMPASALPGEELQALLAYLATLE